MVEEKRHLDLCCLTILYFVIFLLFFQPKKLIFFEDDLVRFEYLGMCDDEMDDDFQQIISTEIKHEDQQERINVQSKLTFKEYETGFNFFIQS